MGHAHDLRDRLVHFRIRDAYLPDPRDLALECHGDDLLQGRIVDVSGDGDGWVVVQVEGFREPIVVEARRVLGVLP